MQRALVVAVAGTEAGGIDQDQVGMACQRAAVQVQLDEQRRLRSGCRVGEQRTVGGQRALFAPDRAAAGVLQPVDHQLFFATCWNVVKFGRQAGAGAEIVLLDVLAQPAVEQRRFADAELADQRHLEQEAADRRA